MCWSCPVHQCSWLGSMWNQGGGRISLVGFCGWLETLEMMTLCASVSVLIACHCPKWQAIGMICGEYCPRYIITTGTWNSSKKGKPRQFSGHTEDQSKPLSQFIHCSGRASSFTVQKAKFYELEHDWKSFWRMSRSLGEKIERTRKGECTSHILLQEWWGVGWSWWLVPVNLTPRS